MKENFEKYSTTGKKNDEWSIFINEEKAVVWRNRRFGSMIWFILTDIGFSELWTPQFFKMYDALKINGNFSYLCPRGVVKRYDWSWVSLKNWRASGKEMFRARNLNYLFSCLIFLAKKIFRVEIIMYVILIDYYFNKCTLLDVSIVI
jgi:hypothetical protein